MKKYLETPRLYLREITDADELELLDLDSDPEVMRYLTQGKPSSRVQVQQMMYRVSAEIERSRGRYGVWSAIEQQSNLFVGWFHLFPPREDPKDFKTLYLGYRLKKRFWDQGYATEVSRALIEKAFTKYGAVEVCAQAMKLNLGSQNVMKKVGMIFRKEYLEKTFPVGSQESVLYSIKKI